MNRIQMKKIIIPLALLQVLILWAFSPVEDDSELPPKYRSPQSVEYSPDGKLLVSADFTNGSLYVIDAHTKSVSKEIADLDRPFDAVWIDEKRVAVSEYGAHRVSVVDISSGDVPQRIPCTPYPMGLDVTNENTLVVCGFGKSEVGIIDLAEQKQTAILPVWYQPDFVSVSPDFSQAWASNLTPKSSKNGAKLSQIDLKTNRVIREVELDFGSTNVRQIIHSPDGKWVYVAHTYGKVMLPTSQLERGWVNSNILSIIDAEKGEVYASVPFDYTIKGGADPWGLAISPDGNELYATLAGVNELAVLNLHDLHRYLSGEAMPEGLAQSDANAKIAYDVWKGIYETPSKRTKLIDQFAALYAAGIIQRYELPLTNPRGIDLSPNGQILSISGYFSGDIAQFDLKKREVTHVLSLGDQPDMTLARKGEILFYDATSTYQKWLSCVSCHPHGRADGLNWDLLNDGIGNPKNAKSLLLSHATPPSMSTGIRANYEVAVRAGFHFIKFNQADEERYEAVRAYLRNMKPDPSPYLVDGKLSASAEKGKQLFESDKAGCYKCHNGDYLTDQKMHGIGTKGEYDRREEFDTPTLIEAWRTAPYLHDGSISNFEELFSKEVRTQHWHGRTKYLNKEEIGNLIEYVQSL